PDVDDYVDGEFQVTADIKPGTEDLVIDAEFHCALSVTEIADQIEQGNASFIVVVSCRETYYREVLSHREAGFTYQFPAGSLRGEVLINPYVVSSERIERFHCSLINEEFGAGPFTFEPGSVLALDQPKIIYVDRDVFKPITSVFELVTDDAL